MCIVFARPCANYRNCKVSEHMEMQYKDFDFKALRRAVPNWSWREVLYGSANGIIPMRDAMAYAYDVLADDTPNFDAVLSLAISGTETEASVFLESLSEDSAWQDESYIKGKWLFAILKDLYRKRADYDNVLVVVDCLYTDFGYPEEIAPLIYYMPMADNGKGCIDSWQDYLLENEVRFNNNWR